MIQSRASQVTSREMSRSSSKDKYMYMSCEKDHMDDNIKYRYDKVFSSSSIYNMTGSTKNNYKESSKLIGKWVSSTSRCRTENNSIPKSCKNVNKPRLDENNYYECSKPSKLFTSKIKNLIDSNRDRFNKTSRMKKDRLSTNIKSLKEQSDDNSNYSEFGSKYERNILAIRNKTIGQEYVNTNERASGSVSKSIHSKLGNKRKSDKKNPL